jgi:hypothetical protein
MKKWLIGFLLVYALGGIFLFYHGKSSTHQDIKPDEPLKWVAQDQKQGNYTAAQWLTNQSKPQEKNDKVKNEPTIANERLMSFFTQIQLGNVQDATGFINPKILHQDFNSSNIEEIENQLEHICNRITQNRSINEVTLSKPKEISTNKVLFDVTIRFNKKEIKLKDIPMVKLTDSMNWSLDITLSQLAAQVEKNL